jgi:predicted RND superfamily exporter protein
MSTYSQIAWLPLTAGLTLVGLLASFYVWRRRGAAAGLRGVAWSLLPLAAYLIGAIELLWRFGTAIGNFATSFVFSPRVWAGIIVVLVSVSLFAVSGGLRGRSRRRAGGQAAAKTVGAAAGPAVTAGKPATKAVSTRKSQGSGGDDDVLGDAAEVLRRHGIR